MAQPILRADLTDQQIQDVGHRIEIGVQEMDDLSELFEVEPFPEKRTDVAYRMLIPQRIKEDDVDSYILHENIAPANRSLKYATYRKTVQKYGTRHEYTAENVEDNPDNVVTDASEDLTNWAVLMKKYSAARALKATHSEIGFDTTLKKTFDKARIILSDVLEAEHWAGNEYLFMCPGQVDIALRDELLALNSGNSAIAIMPSNEKMNAYRGYTGSWNGFSIMIPKGANKYLVDSTYYYCFFIGKTDAGKNPLRLLKKKGSATEVFHKPLGESVMKNAAGEVVADYNHQKGGIGMNLRGFEYYIADDRFVLICKIAKSSLSSLPTITTEIPADGDDDGGVVQTIDRVIRNFGGTTSNSATALAVSVEPATGVTVGTDPIATVDALTTTIQLKANHKVIWASADNTKATVDPVKGIVTFDSGLLADTTVAITAFDGNATKSVNVKYDAA